MKLFIITVLLITKLSLTASPINYRITKSGGPFIIKESSKDQNVINIRTGKKSYTKLLIAETHLLTIGPSSLVTLSLNQSIPIIDLHKGIARLKSPESTHNSYKIFINTNSSSIGVRGTELIVTHNEINQISSVLTLEGELDFYKKKDREIVKKLKESLDEHDEFGKNLKQLDLLDLLQRSSVKSVKQHSFSGAYPTYENPLPPTKISTEQLNSLKNNTTLAFGQEKPIYTKSTLRRNFTLTNKNLIPEPLNILDDTTLSSDQKSHMSYVRHGGILDLKTGIYIMPPENAYYDPVRNMYDLPYEYGGFDYQTGSYIPPTNTRIDPLLGFVTKVKNTWRQVDKFSKGVSELLRKYKKVTRVDLKASMAYKRSNISLENYYGEYRNISKTENMAFNFRSQIGRDLYHSSKYQHYISASLGTTIHNRTKEPEVQRNDTLMTDYQYRFTRKHRFKKRQAFSGLKISFKTQYKDIQNKDQFDFYTESASFALFEKFHFTRRHSINLETGLHAFQSFNEADHGNIKYARLENTYENHGVYKIFFDLGYSNRDNKKEASQFKIFTLGYGVLINGIFRKTNFKLKHKYENHKLTTTSLSQKAKYNQIDFSLHRRKGEYFSFDAYYIYKSFDNETMQNKESFKDNAIGFGASFYF